MRRILSSIVAAIVLVTGSVLVAAPANAATITFDYVIDGTEPTWNRPYGTQIPCSGATSDSYRYRTQVLTVDVDGDYAFRDSGYLDAGLDDGFIAIYSAFDPAAPLSNCLAAIDDNPSNAPVTLTAGTTYTVVQLPLGALPATGSFQFTASGPGTVMIANASSTTSLTVSPNPATVGDTVTLSATVTGASPSGGVEFFADGDSLGTAPLASGVATLPVSSLTAGTHAITATYSGDSDNLPSSTVSAVSLTVNPAPTLEVSSTPADLVATAGVPYTFPVTVIDHTGAALSPQPAITYTSPDCTITGGSVFETAGPCTIEAATTVNGATINAVFQVTVVAAPAHVLTLTPAALAVAQGGSLTFTITGEDVYGNPVDTSGAVLSSSVATDQISGHTVTFPHASPHTITATLGAATDQVTIEVTPAPSVTMPATSALSSTGTVSQGVFWAAALGLLLAGAGAAWFGWHRRQNHH